MTKAISGFSHSSFRGEDLTISWILTPGRPQSLNTLAESDHVEIQAITLERDGLDIPCPDDLFEAFSGDDAAMADLLEKAIEDAIEQRSEAPCPEM